MQSEPAPAAIERKKRQTATGLAVLALGVVSAGLVWLAAGGEAPAEIAGVDADLIASPGPTSFAEIESHREPEAPALASTGADDEIQLCGGHWVKAGADGQPSPEALQALVATSLDEISGVALGLMAASPSPRVQAAAHYYRAGRLAFSSLPSRDRVAEGAPHRDALARLAQLNDDVQVYAWAYRACKGAAASSPGACMQIGAAQWARMDPDNAEPWLAVAEEARRRKDEALLDDAMFHVAAAERHDSAWAALAATVADYTPQDERSLIGTFMAIAQGIRIEAAVSADWHGVSEYCSATATLEPNRSETCERVATMLADRSTSVSARQMGMTIGRRLGWNAERLDALAEQRDAEAMATRLRGADPARDDPMACAAMRASIERLRAHGEFGEVEMLRRDVAHSGLPVAKLAADFRRQRERDRRQVVAGEAVSAETAASAASATTVAHR